MNKFFKSLGMAITVLWYVPIALLVFVMWSPFIVALLDSTIGVIIVGIAVFVFIVNMCSPNESEDDKDESTKL